MVANVALTAEMKRGRKKERDDGASKVIERLVRVEDIVLGFMAESEAGAHHKAVGEREQAESPPGVNATRSTKKQCTEADHQSSQAEIEASGNRMILCGHAFAAVA